jgi:hypothetical protein
LPQIFLPAVVIKSSPADAGAGDEYHVLWKPERNVLGAVVCDNIRCSALREIEHADQSVFHIPKSEIRISLIPSRETAP